MRKLVVAAILISSSASACIVVEEAPARHAPCSSAYTVVAPTGPDPAYAAVPPPIAVSEPQPQPQPDPTPAVDPTPTLSPGGWPTVDANVSISVQGDVPRSIDPNPGIEANAHGKYAGLVKILRVPDDEKTYGDYDDYGYWGPRTWAGAEQPAGYWVYVYPDWYIWQSKIAGK